MGAFLSDLLSKGAEKLGDKLESAIGGAETNKVGRAVLNIWGNKEWELNLHTDAFGKMNNDYIRIQDQTLGAENAKVHAVREWWKNDASARAAVPADAKMNQFHAHAVATGNPIQKITSQIVGAGDGNLTQRELMVKNQHVARLTALSGSFGDHYENVTPILAGMLESKDSRIVANAHRVAEIISNQTRDTKVFTDFQGGHTEQSAAKTYMNKAFMKANKIRAAADIDAKIPLLDTEKTYTPQSEPERMAHRVLNRMLIPFVAIPHIGQLFNIPASAPLKAVGAALFRMDHAEMEKTVEASSILATTAWNAMYRDILGETGKVAEVTNSPDLGRILARTIHEPGFNFVRKTQLNMAGSVGFHSAIYWAHNFAESGSKIAEARLKELDINPVDVLKQKGKLTEEQLQSGVYHYVNNRMFFNRSIDNSLYQNKNIFTRAFFMYHSFVNSQVTFIQRELMLMARAGDIKGISQYVGTLGILFPTVAAPLLGGIETMLRTGSFSRGVESVKHSYKELFDPDSPGAWVSNYFTLAAHLGAAGTYFNYLNAIKANRFAAALGGPMVGMPTEDITDFIHGAFLPNKAGTHNFDPLMRDALKQGVPVIGSALAHTLVPTAAEQKLDGSTTLTSRRRLHRARRKF